MTNANESISIAVCGATGLVGSACVRLLLRDPTFTPVTLVTRRPLDERVRGAGSGKLVERVIDFSRLDDHADAFSAHAVLCALGTTLRRAGSRERFREVDLGYPLRIAELALRRGAGHFLLVSSVGADPGSRFFYSRVKGELEQAILELGYPAVTVVRPSLLLGERREFRPGEQIAKRFGFLAPPRYRPVHAADVAAILVDAARRREPGKRVIESREILERSR